MPNKFILATVVWVVFITYMCMASASQIPEAAWLDIPNKDKAVHFTFYFILTMLLYKDFKVQWGVLKKSFMFAFVTAVGYGIIIEVFQGLFTKERNADVFDVLANTLGSSFAIFILWLRQRLKK